MIDAGGMRAGPGPGLVQREGNEAEQLREGVDEEVGAGGEERLAGAVAVGDAAGADTGRTAHPDVDRHVPHHQGFLRGETEILQGLQHGVRCRLAGRDVVHAQGIADEAVDLHVAQEMVQRGGRPGCGHRHADAPGVQGRERLPHPGKQGRRQHGEVLFEDLPVCLRAQVGQGVVAGRDHLPEALGQGQADRRGAFLIADERQPQPPERLLHRQDDVPPGVAQRTVEIEDNQPDSLGAAGRFPLFILLFQYS